MTNTPTQHKTATVKYVLAVRDAAMEGRYTHDAMIRMRERRG